MFKQLTQAIKRNDALQTEIRAVAEGKTPTHLHLGRDVARISAQDVNS